LGCPAPEDFARSSPSARWLGEWGVRQWPPRFQREWIEPAVLAGDTWLAVDGRHVLATVTLGGADGLWADRPAPAAYVHRLAVRRTAAGLGARILELDGVVCPESKITPA
jgi:hypothetical protein